MEDKSVENKKEVKEDAQQKKLEEAMIMEEFEIEELSVDGICGVY